MSKLAKPNLLWRIWKKIRFYFVIDQWILLLTEGNNYSSLSWSNFKALIPPIDRFWADPFVWIQDDKYYLFVEEVFYSTNRGRIVCLTLDDEMKIESNQVVLEKPYHLSYPFLFEHKNQLYMIPETGGNNRVELYRCVNFPHEWEFEKTLIDNIHALDVTLLEANGKWWLFTYIPENGKTNWDTLHLFYADHPLSDEWKPHPLNPVVRDVRSARPAGRIFTQNGKLIRPAQDCSVRYGYAISFNQIVTLTETDYAEINETVFKPVSNSLYHAAHTYNQTTNLTVIDAIYHRRRF